VAGIPERYVVFDTETKERVHCEEPRHVSLHFWIGCCKVVDNSQPEGKRSAFHDFTDTEDFFRLLDGLPKTNEKVWIFAHNLGFDLRIIGLFDQVCFGRYSLLNPHPSKKSRTQETPFLVLDDPPTIVRLFRPDGQELMFVDTWQWLSSPLAKIGKILGNAKGEMPTVDSPIVEWFDYCRQDVAVLDDAINRVFTWLRENGYKTFHPTRAGQAKLIYSERYEHKRIKYHNNSDIQAIERPSYYGGFTECFRVGTIDGPIHQVDANSLYPFVMSKYWYPCEVIDYQSSDDDSTFKVMKNPKRCIAEVYLNSKTRTYPIRCREGTIFASGKVRTILSGPELSRAFLEGDVVRTSRYVAYRLEPLFTDFVRDLYNFRLKAKREGNEIFDYCYKLMLNSLYGKFGQQTAEWEYFGRTDDDSVYSQGWTVDDGSDVPIETRVIAGTSYRRQVPVDHPKSFVAIASYVTGYAREYMRSIRESLPEGSSYYQATDSLYVSDEGFAELGIRRLLNPETLGAFKHEASYKKLIIRNIHNLDKDDKKIRGSIRGKAREVSEDTFVQESWESLLPGLKLGHSSEVHIKTIMKRLTHRYDRQVVLPDGSTVPHKVDNWDITPTEQSERWLFRRSGGVNRLEGLA